MSEHEPANDDFVRDIRNVLLDRDNTEALKLRMQLSMLIALHNIAGGINEIAGCAKDQSRKSGGKPKS